MIGEDQYACLVFLEHHSELQQDVLVKPGHIRDETLATGDVAHHALEQADAHDILIGPNHDPFVRLFAQKIVRDIPDIRKVVTVRQSDETLAHLFVHVGKGVIQVIHVVHDSVDEPGYNRSRDPVNHVLERRFESCDREQ